MLKRYAALLALLMACVMLSPAATYRVPAVEAFAEGLTVEVAPLATPAIPPEPTASPAPDGMEDVFLQVEVIRDTAPPPGYAGKRVLIYHTHTYEAYTQVDGDRYQQTEKWRTADPTHNVVAVGKALSASLTALGLQVTHDTTAFEPPDLDDAYARSLKMLEHRASSGETYDLYIDLHRDALGSTSTIKRTVNVSGIEVARFMVLVGQGTTGGYELKPDWQTNLIIAQRITDHLNSQIDGLCRDVKVKTGRFNQHIAPCCVLIECGMNTNTLEQVLNGVPYLAQAIADALGE